MVGRRALDLYALGCVLYELVCGRPPFVGDESVAIITQHLNTPPVAPSWHRPGLSAGTESLILRFWRRNRPSARSAIEVLPGARGDQPIDRGAATVSRTQPSPVDDAPTLPADLRRARSELRQLQAAFDEPFRSGLAGHGGRRTGHRQDRPVRAIGHLRRGAWGRTLVGHCYEEGSLSLPYLAFVEALRTYVLARTPRR